MIQIGIGIWSGVGGLLDAVTSVVISGLSSGAARDAVQLSYTAVNLPDGVTVTGQSWETSASGVLATTATYTPDASANDLEGLFLVLTLSDASTVTSNVYTIRYAPPVAGSLAAVNETQGVGTIIVDLSAGFPGSDPGTYTANVGWITVNGSNGEIDQNQVLDASAAITKTNSGGSDTVSLAVTISAAGNPITIDDFPNADGENEITYTPGGDSVVTSTVTVGGTQDSEVSFAALGVDEAAVQRAPIISGGTAPDDTLTATRPQVHYTVAALTERFEWLLGGVPTGNYGLSYTREASTNPVVLRYEVLDAGGSVILQYDTPAAATDITPVAPDLTDSAFTQVVSTTRVFSVFTDEDEETENLSLDSLVKVSGDAVLDSTDLETGEFTVSTPATEGDSVFRATISNGTGGSATKDLTITSTLGVDLTATIFNAENLTYDANCFEQDFSGNIALQNAPDNPTAGEAFGIWAGTAGTYDVTLSFRTDVDGDGTDVWALLVNDVEIESWTADGVANGFEDRVSSSVAIAPDDKVSVTLNGYDAVGGPIWAAFDTIEFTQVTANLMTSPSDPTGWTTFGGASLTDGRPDSASGSDAVLYTSTADGDAFTMPYASAVNGNSYTFTAIVRANSMTANQNIRFVIFGASVWFRINSGTKNNDGHTTTLTDLGSGWWQVDIDCTASNEAGDVTLTVADNNGSFTEASGSFDIHAIKLEAQ